MRANTASKTAAAPSERRPMTYINADLNGKSISEILRIGGEVADTLEQERSIKISRITFVKHEGEYISIFFGLRTEADVDIPEDDRLWNIVGE